MSDDLSWRLATPRFTGKGNRSRVACGHKKSRDHSRGSEGGPQIEQARLFPHPVFGKTVADVRSDLMSMKSRSSGFEVVLLASPSHPRPDSGFSRRSSLVTAGLYHTGFAPVFLFSRGYRRGHSSRC